MIFKMDLQLFGGNGNKSASGKRGTKQVAVAGGGVINLDKSLIYGDKISDLNGNPRNIVESWENKKGQGKIEYALVIDENGRVIEESRGGKGSVKTSISALDTEGGTLTHIHPRGETDVLGGTFSTQDLTNFSSFRIKTYRARAKEGTYTITKTNSFKSQEFKNFVKNSRDKNYDNYKKICEKASLDFHSGKISYNTLCKIYNNNFNTYLVGMHNDLLSGQSTYGYKYSLERNII